jgi:hypothetical protein
MNEILKQLENDIDLRLAFLEKAKIYQINGSLVTIMTVLGNNTVRNIIRSVKI